MPSCPRIVIAGTQSGVGKTSLCLALVAALKRSGLRVQTFKVGPDFLDPSHLTLASGRPCYNLDGWMSGKDYVERLFARVSGNADISVIEGVMGLFDGADPVTSEGSTAEIAQWLDAPVLLVVDAHGASRSLAATVKGFAEFDPRVRVAGVLANRTGSERHAATLAESLRAFSLPPLVGAIRRESLPNLPSRHLGLVTADEANLSHAKLDALADAFESQISVDTVLQLARTAPSLKITTAPASPRSGAGLRIGVAQDEAFHFYYQDLLDELALRGCEIVRFSPIRDAHLPPNLDGLYLGGGYPEVHADTLAANESMLADIRCFAEQNRPVYAECGGLMYLSKELRTLNGDARSMVGLLPASVRMLDRRKALGYVEATLTDDSLWGAEGTALRGHEFHYSDLIDDAPPADGWASAYSLATRRTGQARPEGFQWRSVVASYAHLHLASRPEAIDHFLNKCRGQR